MQRRLARHAGRPVPSRCARPASVAEDVAMQEHSSLTTDAGEVMITALRRTVLREGCSPVNYGSGARAEAATVEPRSARVDIADMSDR